METGRHRRIPVHGGATCLRLIRFGNWAGNYSGRECRAVTRSELFRNSLNTGTTWKPKDGPQVTRWKPPDQPPAKSWVILMNWPKNCWQPGGDLIGAAGIR